jgi:hypothetical protein
MDTPTYPDAIQAWRHEMEARLRADEGWLTLAGLHWLKEGPNRFGTDPGSDIVLPPPQLRVGRGTLSCWAPR